MAEVLGLQTGLDVSLTGTLGGFATYLLYIILFFIVVAIGGALIWYFNNKALYKYQIIVFENISGKGWQRGKDDKARIIRIASDGTYNFFLKNRKIPLGASGAKKMDTNQYWYAIAQDGSFVNFVVGDLDAKMGILDIEPIDRNVKWDMVNSLKQNKDEFGQKKGLFEKYGVWVVSILVILIIIAGFVYIIKEIGGVADSLASTSKILAEAIKASSSSSNTGLVQVA